MRAERLRGLMATAFRTLRDGWLIVGIALLMLVGLELGFRAQGSVRRALGTKEARGMVALPAHPEAVKPWFSSWHTSDSLRPAALRFDPYRLWAHRPFVSSHMNVDSAGHRVTVSPMAPTSPQFTVFLLGGSTMFGVTAPDSTTIPSQIAGQLHALGYDDIAIVNLGMAAFNATQDLVTLLLELRRGSVPDVAVFLQGHNEIAPAYRSGSAGTVFNQEGIEQHLRRSLDSADLKPVILRLAQRSELFQRLTMMVHGPPAQDTAPMWPPELCADIARYYRELVRSAEALGREFGFKTLFFWTPTLAMTRKPLTAWERSITSQPGYQDMLRRCTETADSAMRDRRGATFVALHDLFDAETATVYLDAYAHVTEEGNGAIAKAIVDRLVPLLPPPTRAKP